MCSRVVVRERIRHVHMVVDRCTGSFLANNYFSLDCSIENVLSLLSFNVRPLWGLLVLEPTLPWKVGLRSQALCCCYQCVEFTELGHIKLTSPFSLVMESEINVACTYYCCSFHRGLWARVFNYLNQAFYVREKEGSPHRNICLVRHWLFLQCIILSFIAKYTEFFNPPGSARVAIFSSTFWPLQMAP